MTIGTILQVYYELNIDLLNIDELKRIPKKLLPSLLKITESKNSEEFLRKYKSCFVPPFYDGENLPKNDDAPSVGIYDLVVFAGACGLGNFKEFKVWELLAFMKGQNKSSWGRLSALMALINNAHCTKKSALKEPDDFNPTITEKEKAEKRRKNAVPIERLFNAE